jgi:hypothetical protein
MKERIETLGGLHEGHLIEYLYDAKTQKASLAWRDPEGNIDSGDVLETHASVFVPVEPTPLITTGSILYPSELGKAYSPSELLIKIKYYLSSLILFSDENDAEMIAVWLLKSWIYDCFVTTQYLVVTAGLGCGKSETVYRSSLLAYHPMWCGNFTSQASSIRAANSYQTTMVIDETDDIFNPESELSKFCRMGTMKGRPLSKMEHGKGFVHYNTFFPKMLATRFIEEIDDAIRGNSIRIHMKPMEIVDVLKAEIPLQITDSAKVRAQNLRNSLLRFRLEYWREEIDPNVCRYDLNISANLNRFSATLITALENDPTAQQSVRETVQKYFERNRPTPETVDQVIFTINNLKGGEMASTTIKWFEFAHLPEKLQEVSIPCAELAHEMEDKLPDGAEKSAGMRKLLEAKDCFVRAALEQ